MIFSETFFRVRDGSSKEYLQEHIKFHPLWNDIGFWEEAFLSGVRSEAVKTLPSSRDVEGSALTYSQILFSQLSSYAFTMRAFGASDETTKKFIENMSMYTKTDAAYILTELGL